MADCTAPPETTARAAIRQRQEDIAALRAAIAKKKAREAAAQSSNSNWSCFSFDAVSSVESPRPSPAVAKPQQGVPEEAMGFPRGAAAPAYRLGGGN